MGLNCEQDPNCEVHKAVAGRSRPFITKSEARETGKEKEMPVAYVDIPAGVNDGAKKKTFQLH